MNISQIAREWHANRPRMIRESPANELRAKGLKHDESCWGLVLGFGMVEEE